MPYLMVNLDDPADCRRAWDELGSRLGGGGGPQPGRGRCGPPRGRHGRGHHRPEAEHAPPQHAGRGPDAGPPRPDLPLMQKLQRIRPRGIWVYLQQIATQVDQPLSLPELDDKLGLAKNKMRSVKAIMGKLEHRWGLELLVPDPQGSVDAAGNPRYIMPPRLRNKVVKLSD